MVQVHGESFPALSILDPYKYLGLQVLATGTRASVEEQLQFKLEQVTKAPLKPQQRMFNPTDKHFNGTFPSIGAG